MAHLTMMDEVTVSNSNGVTEVVTTHGDDIDGTNANIQSGYRTTDTEWA